MDRLEYVGQIIGDFRLVSWLGGGGFGNVYLAEEVRDGQQAAVKILQVRLTQEEDFRAFITEARTMRLRHPHIVPLLDFGLGRDGTPFLVMEYAPLGTLRERHPKGSSIALPLAIEYATQIASALQYAHDARLVHRDVKPENMLVRADGQVLLSDFGIATNVQSSASIKSSNQGMSGTLAYMAPEQLRGQPRAASDQYALAIVIYEWLTGKVPFRGTALEVATQHATQAPPALMTQAQGIPQEVENVLFKALAKDYKDRFASMDAFLSALQGASAFSMFHLPAFTRPLATQATYSSYKETFDMKSVSTVRPNPPFLNQYREQSQQIPTATSSPKNEKRPNKLRRRMILAMIATISTGTIVVASLNALNNTDVSENVTVSINHKSNQTQTPITQSTQAAKEKSTPVMKHPGTLVGINTQPKNSSTQFTNPADDNKSLLLCLSDGKFVAAEQACTHQGVLVNYDTATGKLVCPAHGSIFDPANKFAVLQGPATTALKPVTITVNGDGTISA